MHGATIQIDVGSIRLISTNDHFGTKFAQHAWSRLVGRAVRAINNDADPIQRHLFGEGRFSEFNVAAQRVIDTDGFANFTGGRTNAFDCSTENKLFDPDLNVIIEFITVRPEKFYTVII